MKLFSIFKKQKTINIETEIKDLSEFLLPGYFIDEHKIKHNEVLKHFNRKSIQNSISSYKVLINSLYKNINTCEQLYKHLNTLKSRIDNDNDVDTITISDIKCVCSALLSDKLYDLQKTIKDNKTEIQQLKLDLKVKVKWLNINSKLQYSLYLLKLIADKYSVDVDKINHFYRVSFDVLDKCSYDEIFYFLNKYNDKLKELLDDKIKL